MEPSAQPLQRPSPSPTSAAGLQVLGLALLVLTAASFADPIDSGSAVSGSIVSGYVHRVFGPEEGLPRAPIVQVLRARDGELWLATLDGLARFDGLTCEVFDSERYPALGSNRIQRLVESRDGTLWIRTEQGYLSRYAEGRFTACGPPVQGRVRCDADGEHGRLGGVTEAPDGSLWLGSFSGIYRWDGETFQQETTIDSTEVTRTLFPDSMGRLWVGTRKNLWVGRPGSFERVDLGMEVGVSDVAETPQGEIWVLTDRGVGRVRGGRFEVEAEEAYLAVDARGTLWTGRTDGLWRRQGEAWESVAAGVFPESYVGIHVAGSGSTAWMAWGPTLWRDGVPVLRFPAKTSVTSLKVDQQGIVWISTSASSRLHALVPERLTTLTEGLEVSDLLSVYEDRDGTLWVGGGAYVATLAPGEVRFQSRPGPRRPPGSFPIDSYPRSFLRDRSGTLWIGTLRGLFTLDGDEYRGPLGPETLHWQVSALLEGASGELWASTEKGLHRRSPEGVWNHFNAKEIRDRVIRVLHEFPSGTLWLGTNGNGLVRFRNGRFTRIDRASGLPSDLVQALWTSPDGHLWIATENRGLARLDPATVDAPNGPETAVVSRAQGLYSSGVHHMVDDGLGHLWMSSNQGIFRVTRTELEAVADGELDRLESVAFTDRDGMADRQANGGVQQTGLRDREGRLWFPTKAGVVRIDPRTIAIASEAPVRVATLEAGGDSLNTAAGSARLAPRQRSFNVTYTAPSFRAPERLRFRYRLVPYDDDWVEAGTRREARYTKVPPGHYIFEVAVNEDGVWSPRPATLAIDVEPRFFETRSFLVLGITAVAAAFLLAVRLRESRARARQRELEQVVRERTATIAEQAERLRELDRLKSEFFANVSHELRTPLTLMLGPLRDALTGAFGPLSERLRPQIELAAGQAESQLGLVEQLLDVARSDAGRLRLRPRRNDLAQLVRRRVEAFLFLAEQQEIELSIEVPEGPIETVHDPVEIAKVVDNLLSNALKFTPPGGLVDVLVEEHDSEAKITVTDNGPGIAPDQRERIFDRFERADNSGRKPGAGLGLALARQLAEMHRGRLELVTPANGELPDGACFVVTLPRHLDIEEDDGDTVSVMDGESAAKSDFTNVPPPCPVDYTSGSDNGDGNEPGEVDRPTVLVVDDHAEIRMYARRHLEGAYRVLEAADGDEALDRARQHPPDLVVSDVMMPGLDGYGLFRKLRQDPELELVPVVLVTAKASLASRLDGLHEGVDDYLVKPFDGRELRARIDNLLAARRRLLDQVELPLPRALELSKAQALPSDQDLLRRVRSILEERLGDSDFNVGELARELSCSRAYLTNKVKELTGETPGALIRSCRLERAAQLLRANAGPVGEIGYSVGFKSIAHFSNAFFQRFGERPSSLAARHRGA